MVFIVICKVRHKPASAKCSIRDWVSIDTGMVVVVFICIMYLALVFGLLFYVKNEWCDLLFKNMTVKGSNKLFFALIWFDKIKLILVNLEIHVLNGPYFAGHLFAVWK